MKIESCVQVLKKNKFKIALIAGGIIVLLIVLHILSHLGTDRRVFYFPISGSSKLQKEVRYIDSEAVQGKIQCYIDELMLGPSVYRSRPIFTSGTKREYCVLKNKTLYVGLSEDAVLQEDGSCEMSRAVALLKKNIKKNFTGIKNIEIFIDGNFIDLDLKD